jgi:hypothetical protein
MKRIEHVDCLRIVGYEYVNVEQNYIRARTEMQITRWLDEKANKPGREKLDSYSQENARYTDRDLSTPELE